MAEISLDDDLARDYLAECREHLATIETDLLALEQDGAEIDEELVNRVFRAAHSIKGGAGFFGLTRIRELAHKTENVLDMIRSRQMTPASDVVNVLLLSFDKLSELIGNCATSNEADITEFVDALTNLTRDHLPTAQKGTVTEQVEIPLPGASRFIRVSAFDLGQARKGAKTVYLIEYDLIHDVQRRGKTPLDELRNLMQAGTILDTVCDWNPRAVWMTPRPTNSFCRSCTPAYWSRTSSVRWCQCRPIGFGLLNVTAK